MFWKQLSLLLWKNAILRKRHWVRTIVEIVWPLFLFAILVAIRQSQTIETIQECHYPARAMPSAGVYPLFKSFLCDLQNPCFSEVVPSEVPGQVNAPLDENDNSTKLLSALSSLWKLLNDDSSISDDAFDVANLINEGHNITSPEIESKLSSLATKVSSGNQNKEDIQSLATLTQSLSSFRKAGNTDPSFFSTLFMVDFSSPNGFNEFCGHPIPKDQSNDSSSTNQTNNDMSGFFTNLTANLDIGSPSFCTDLRQKLEDKNNTKQYVLFNLVKPFILGKIPYYPNTPVVQNIIQNANATFETLALIQKFGEDWQKSIGPKLYQDLENGRNTNRLRTFLNTTVGMESIAKQINISLDEVKQLKEFLSNTNDPNDDNITWKDVYNDVNTTIAWVTKLLECSELNKFVGFDSEDELVQKSMSHVENKTLWASIVFLSPNSSDEVLPKIVKYEIRQDASSVTRTNKVQSYVWFPGAESNATAVNEQITQENPVRYYISGFVHVQDMIENAIVLARAERSGFNISTPVSLGGYLQEMPYPCYTSDLFLEFLPALFSLLMTLAWVYSVCIIIKSIVYEKEKRLKEVMKMMGLSNGVHWVAWFINAFAVMLCSIILLLIGLKFGRILPSSNLFILFIWLSCFAFATIAQCFLISCFFTKANLAAACGGIIFFVLYIPYNVVYIFQREMTYSTMLLACLLSSVSFGYGAGYASQYEMSGKGIQFSNWAQSYDPADPMNFLTSMIMMLVDAVLYLLLTWYIENVYPGTYGVPKPWNFFLKRSYWCGKSKQDYQVLSNDCNSDISINDDVKMEKEPTHLKLGVSMNRLRKVFDNGKVAVDGLSLNFYEGQITSFLGHNGAGKTTTMSMLTGLYTPSSGSASIYGSDIQAEMDQVRHQLGFCPQHNVLFGDLTVLEHLQFYCGLKNAVGGVKEDRLEIENMLKDVGLPHKQDEITRHLSGGMKRKLSVAVAFVGNSKCVILDEPTAGVDPYARRGIWDLLLRYRANRTILLSTHHMDEADLLGDRIAIINHGKLKCCGSSLFLKSSYGVGYYLTVVKDNQVTDSTENLNKNRATSQMTAVPDLLKDHSDSAKLSDEGFGSTSDLTWQPSTSRGSPRRTLTFDHSLNNDPSRFTRINNLVFSVIPQAKIQEDNQREVSFILPYSAQSGGRYCLLFQRLDDCGMTYGLTDTSLEEIFMSVAEQSQESVEEETVKCCFCIPRKVKPKPRDPESPDGQARRGMRRSVTTRSINSNFSGHSSAPLFTHFENDDDDVSLILEEDVDAGDDNLFLGADAPQDAGASKVKGNKLVWQQFKALFVKRYHNSKRNRKGLVAQVIVPAGFIALGLLCALAAPRLKNYPPLELQPWMYGSSYTFYSNDQPNNSFSSNASQSLLNSPTVGMRCVNDYQVRNYDDSLLTCGQQHYDELWTDDNRTAGQSQDAFDNQTLTCTCSTNDSRVLLAECPFGAGGSPTPLVQTQSSDWLYNMTGRNLSDWLVKTVDKFIEKRFGGVSFGASLHTSVTPEYLSSLVDLAHTYSNFTLTSSTGKVASVSQFYQNLARTENHKIWFDNTGFHSMPTWMNVKNNAALRSLLKPNEDPSDYGIVSVNHPLNFTNSSLDAAARSSAITSTLVSVCAIFALSFIPASFILFLIEEKITKSKHLQFVSGVNASIYWISTYVWDMINYVISISIIILIFVAFQTRAYVSADNFPCLVCLLFFYGFSITPMMYPASFYFEVPSTAYVVLTCVNMFIGINASLITFILQGLRISYLDFVNEKLRVVFLIFPQYCLGRGLIDMAVQQSYADALTTITGVEKVVNPFEFDKVGRNILVMAIEGVVFFILTLLIQYRYFSKPCGVKRGHQVPSRSTDVDTDIVSERRRVLEGRNNDILTIKNLTKVYKKRGTKSTLVAVDKLCVGVPEGECFGLLGVNGAGKTTTFKMLTGDTTPTGGDAYICGQSVLDNLKEVQQNTGYCPQFEALSSLLTGREHLTFYAKLRGVPPSNIERVADWSVNKFGLRLYADKPAGTYSGGNKRKLSAAIAFIGCPPIVFLDEPTAGMDPMSRRFLWTRIIEAVRMGRSVVLTSHSMEECEALCTRLAIMVNGKLKCIGSPQHLKNKYGEGYTITIKVVGSESNYEEVQNAIKSSFPNALIKESHCNMLMYQLPFKDVKLSKLFVILDGFKKSMLVEDYSINQTTLDEVFVSFAKNQTDSIEDAFQPLNDDSVVDFSQLADRAREQSHIALNDLTADPNADNNSTHSELLV